MGRPAVAALRAAGHDVISLVRERRNVDVPGFAEVVVDLLSRDEQISRLFANERPDALIHLAWETAHGRFWDAPANRDWIIASVRLSEAFAESGGKHLIVAGTCVEYDPPAEGPCVAEMTRVRPMSLYATCKDALHKQLDVLCAQRDIRLVWARVFFLYGPDEKLERLVPMVIRTLLRNESARCSSGSQIRDFLHTQDAGRLLAAILDSDVHGSVNVSSGRPVTVREVVSAIADLVGKPSNVTLGALPERPGEPINLWGDAESLFAAVKFTPEFDLRSGLIDTIKWHQRQLAA